MEPADVDGRQDPVAADRDRSDDADEPAEGSEYFEAGGHLWWSTWMARDDIAPGFRIGFTYQIK